MSRTMTRSRRNAAVPQVPFLGPTGTLPNPAFSDAGSRGALASRRLLPSPSGIINVAMPGEPCSSVNRAMPSSTAVSGVPAAISSSRRLCPLESSSARFRSVISVIVPEVPAGSPRSSRVSRAQTSTQRKPPSRVR